MIITVKDDVEQYIHDFVREQVARLTIEYGFTLEEAFTRVYAGAINYKASPSTAGIDVKNMIFKALDELRQEISEVKNDLS